MANSPYRWQLPWFVLGDLQCLMSTESSAYQNDFIRRLVGIERDEDFVSVLTPSPGPGQPAEPGIVAIIRETVATRAVACYDWSDATDTPWPAGLSLYFRRMPQESREMVVGPDRIVLPWPFEASGAEDWNAFAARVEDLKVDNPALVASTGGMSSAVDFDPATDAFMNGVLYAADKLVMENQSTLPANSNDARGALQGQLAANLPSILAVTHTDELATDETWIGAYAPGAPTPQGTNTLHLCLGTGPECAPLPPNKALLFRDWPCGGFRTSP